MGVGRLLLKDILNALARPGRDPREDLPPPIFRTGILKLEEGGLRVTLIKAIVEAASRAAELVNDE